MSIKRRAQWSVILTIAVGLALPGVLLLLSDASETHAGASMDLPGPPQASSMIMTHHSSSVEPPLNTRLSSDNNPGTHNTHITVNDSGIISTSLNPIHSQSVHLAHYILFEMWPDGSIHPLRHQLVQLSAPLDTLSNQDLARRLQGPGRDVQQLEIALKSSQGRTIYQNTVQVPRWLRGEFHVREPVMAQALIDGYFFPLERQTFVVRVPVIGNTSLAVRDSRARTIVRFDLEQLARDTPKIHIEPTTQLRSGWSNGSSANRVDLLILGDGYTAAQQTKFDNDAASIAADFFTISPYAEYSNYVITHSLHVPSAQAGADHPPYQEGCQDISCCGDPAMLSDPLRGTFVDTAFDARFCTNNIHRLLTVDYSQVLAAAAAVPDWDEILVIVNDPTYGGSGGYFSVISVHDSAPQIAQHEYGHSFVGLADEYESPYPGYPPCSDISGSPCEVNVTDVMTRSLIKWSPWISPSTPIPTEPEFDPAFTNIVGLFEGARYMTTGIYRPGQTCIMRSLGAPSCQIPSQAYVLTLYNGGWGVPSSGIRLIEPGSPAPTTDTIPLWYPSNQVFGADILQPIGSPPVSIQWMVNGVPDLLAHTNAFTYTPVISDVGNNVEIQLLVLDMTPLVHPAMAGTSLRSSHIWTVTVNAQPPTDVVISGPETGIVNTTDAFTATVVPPTATLPITYTWSPVPESGQGTARVTYTWAVTGPQTIVVTATNVAGVPVSDTHTITIETKKQWIYLPIMLKNPGP